jgi:hypothetical protein
MRTLIVASCAAAASLFGCTFPQTKMVPVADYGSAARPTISSQPVWTAGDSYTRTYSPDGATLFVCSDGSTRKGNRVAPASTPAC